MNTWVMRVCCALVAALVCVKVAYANILTCDPGSAGYVAPAQSGCSLSISTNSLPSVGGTISMQATCPSGWTPDNFSVVRIGPDGSYQFSGYDSWQQGGNATTSPITWQFGRWAQGPNNTCTVITAPVVEANTYVTVQASPNPATVNQTVTITATVHGAAPTGTLSFYWYTTNLCSVSVSGGTGSCTYTPTTTGSFNTGVHYSGDSQNAGSDSAPVSVQVQNESPPPPNGTATTLSSSLNPSQPGDAVTFTARVQSSNGTPTGTVTFTDNGSTLCSGVNLSSGSATCATSTLTAGKHQISANFNGNATYPASSDTLTQTVGAGGGGLPNTTTTLTATPNPVSAGTVLTLTATVTGGTSPTGTVDFYADRNVPFDYGKVLCSAAVSSGTATCTNTTLAQGSHTLVAIYSGDSNHQGSTSSSVAETVGPPGSPPPVSKLTLSTSPNPSAVGQAVNFVVGLDASLAGGYVRVAVDGTNYCSYVVPISNVPATATACSDSALTAGSHTISATWSADLYSNPSQTATPVAQVVSAASATTTTLTSSWPISIAGHAVELKAVIAGNGPTGSVTFAEGAQTLCNAVPVRVIAGNSVAYCVARFANAGTDILTAAYGGDSRNAASTGTLTQTVGAATTFNENQFGLTGAWYNPATGGQGVLIHTMPGIDGSHGILFAGWFTYDGEGHPRWYAAQGALDGTALALYQGTGGNFNAPPKVGAMAVGSATLAFADCSHATLTYQFTDGSNRTGTIPMTRLMAPQTCSAAGDASAAGVDYGLSGSFYSPATSGQGILFEVNPERQLIFGAWYTYAQAGSLQSGPSTQRWYTLQGSFTPGTRSMTNVPIFAGSGGVFDDPSPYTATQVGTANITYLGCNSVKVDYTFTAGELVGLSNSVTQARLGPTPSGCQ